MSSDDYTAYPPSTEFPTFSSQAADEGNTPSPVSGPARRLRGSSFTVPEDIEIVKAWINTSVDSIHGNDQTKNTFWGRVHETFHTYKNFASDRDERSLRQRWALIQGAVNKFCGAIDQMHGAMSGANEQDKIIAAKILYEDTHKKKFVFDHCWNLLKLQPKWINERSGKAHNSSVNISSPISLEDEAGGSNVPDPLQRPPGRNAEKRKAKEREQPASSEYLRRLIESKEHTDAIYVEALHEKREASRISLDIRRQALQLTKEKQEAEQEERDEKIMFMDTSGMSPDQVAYIEMKRRIIMERVHRAAGGHI